MSKTRVVIFTTNNARMVTNPSPKRLDEFMSWPNAFLNPDLSKVLNVMAPHFWKLDGRGQFCCQNEKEQSATLESHQKTGVDNKLQRLDSFAWALEDSVWDDVKFWAIRVGAFGALVAAGLAAKHFL